MARFKQDTRQGLSVKIPGHIVKTPPDFHIFKTLRAADELCSLADEGEAHSEDDGCCVLYGIVRDCAYKIRGRAQQEREKHARAKSRPERANPDTTGANKRLE